jgi:acyl carrier protein
MPENATATTEHLDELRVLVAEVLEIETDELTDTSDFVADHGADSLMAIEILARIERDLGVHIPQDALSELTDLTSVRRVVDTYRSPGAAR